MLLISSEGLLDSLPEKFYHLTNSFIYGLRFDTVVSGYILALPLVVLTFAALFKFKDKFLNKAVMTYMILLYLVSFFICSADIPYFKYYFSRLSVSALAWKGNPDFMFRLVYQEWSYLKFFFLFLISSVVFVYIIIRFGIKILHRNEYTRFSLTLTFSIISMIILFAGIRGRLSEKSPIRAGTAYFSNYAFPNQLGLNPVFTFINSWLDMRKASNISLRLMDDSTALTLASRWLNPLSVNKTEAISPIARFINPVGNPLNANIVLVIMENMSAEKMSHFGNKDNLTPVLDSIADNSLCFNNIYTAGIHTYNGVFSTLFSFPAILRQHPMNSTVIRQFSGFAKTMKYHKSIYFTTHDEQFDNISGFLRSNGFNYIVSQKDYPSAKILSTLGVPDHFMFEYSIQRINELHNGGNLFFACFMTASDHGPYVIPDEINFSAKHSNTHKSIVEYADWSIGRFLKLSSQQKWFTNTIFVFIADHGAFSEHTTPFPFAYDMPLSYNHTPLIIYSPSIIDRPMQYDCLGGQIDVFPTLMGILNCSYVNNTMGIDLLKEKRPYIYFSADDKIGCLDNDFFYVYRTNGMESLYKYRNFDPENYLGVFKTKADSMKTYAFSMIQASQWLIINNKTAIP